jgi:hypothetical protein
MFLGDEEVRRKGEGEGGKEQLIGAPLIFFMCVFNFFSSFDFLQGSIPNVASHPPIEKITDIFALVSFRKGSQMVSAAVRKWTKRNGR